MLDVCVCLLAGVGCLQYRIIPGNHGIPASHHLIFVPAALNFQLIKRSINYQVLEGIKQCKCNYDTFEAFPLQIVLCLGWCRIFITLKWRAIDEVNMVYL